MPKVIGVIQVKGGAGRSTVSTNLAGELSKLGKTVLIDCDMPQGTSASWYAVRQQKGKEGALIAETATTHKELVNKVEQYQDADFIVLDGPPRIAELTRATLILADVCLIPVGASAAEIWATGDILALIEETGQTGQCEDALDKVQATHQAGAKPDRAGKAGAGSAGAGYILGDAGLLHGGTWGRSDRRRDG